MVGESRSTITNEILIFTGELESKLFHPIHPKVGFYSRKDWWNLWVDARYVKMAGRSSWFAQWPYGTVRSDYPIVYPTGWPKPDIWQQSCTGHKAYGTVGDGKEWGVSSYGLDLNVSYMSRLEFYNYFKLTGGLPAPDPTPIPKVAIAFMSRAGTRFRSQPVDSASIIVTLPTGTGPWPIEQTAIDPSGRVWYKVSGNSYKTAWVASWVVDPIYDI
jgi:hypothetical protein